MDSMHIIRSELKAQVINAQSVAQLMVDRLSTSSNTTVFIDVQLDRKWSKRQTLDSSLNFASFLLNDFNLKSGDIVLFVAPNSDIHAVAIIGVMAAGGVYASTIPDSAEREIREIVDNIRPKVLIGFKDNIHTIVRIGNELKIRTLVVDSNDTSNALAVEDIFRRSRVESEQQLPVLTAPEAMATLVMSSGSTGRPKAIIRTNRNILATIATFDHKELCPITAEDVVLSSGFFHICGQKNLFSVINAGAKLAIVRSDETHEDVYQSIHKYSITSAVLIPTQLNFLVKNSHKFNKKYLKSLSDVLTGSAPLSTHVYQQTVQTFDFSKFRNSYGMSECGFALTVHLSDCKTIENKETVGKVNPGMEIKVIDVNGNSLGANQIGEICVRGDQVTPGYLNKPLETEKLFTSDGFIRSGDIGYYNEQHFFFIIGRAKHVIKVDGVTVSPVELEHILVGHKEVENAAVIGITDDERGEIPMAFVTLVKSSTVTEQTLVEYVNLRVNDFKKLRGGLKVLESMPMTHSGKVKRTELLKLALI